MALYQEVSGDEEEPVEGWIQRPLEHIFTLIVDKFTNHLYMEQGAHRNQLKGGNWRR